MSGPVDVLHALGQADVALGVAGLRQENIFRLELRAAAVAVAELIEAAAEMNCLAKGPTGGVSASDKRAVIARMDAALADVGGAK